MTFPYFEFEINLCFLKAKDRASLQRFFTCTEYASPLLHYDTLLASLLYSYFVLVRHLLLLFLLSSNLDWEFSSFAFFRSLVGNFFFFVFFRGQGWTFSPWVKVYGKLGFWLKACRTAGHDICQGVGLASGSGIKGMSHIISMTHMQQ